jgi:hypothetical protein
MVIATPPHIRLLLAIEEFASLVDYEDAAGIDKPLTIRHSRSRKPVRSEKPAATIIFVGDDPQQAEMQRNSWETVRELVVDIQVDLELDTENSGVDPTGLLYLSLVVAAFVKSLKDPDQPVFLGGMCDWISIRSIDPEERSQPDDGRMTRALTVLYRVRSDDANVLLAAGENG